MKSDSKSKKKDDAESPKVKKKPKRRYRNDRSKKWQQPSSESSIVSEDDSLTSDEYSSNDEKRKSTKNKRGRSKSKPKQRQHTSSSSNSKSPSPDKREKTKKRPEDRDKSSDSKSNNDQKKYKKKENKRSPVQVKRRRRSISNSSESESHEKSRSRSPVRKKKQSPERRRRRSRSHSPAKPRKKSPVKLKRRSRSHSRSPSRSKRKERTKSPDDKRDAKRRKEEKSSETRERKDERQKEEKKLEESEEERKKEREEQREKEKEEERKKGKEEERKKGKEEEKKKEKEEVRKKEKEEVRKKEKEEQRQKEKEREEKERRKEKEEIERAKEKEKEKERERKEKEKERKERERERKEKEKEKERVREREKEKERSREKEKERSRRDDSDKDSRESRRKDDRANDKDEKDRKRKDEKDSKSSSNRDKSPENKKTIPDIEEEMKKRKDRIEAWRNARKKEQRKVEEKEDPEDEGQTKVWSLEDDDDEEEENITENGKTDESEKEGDSGSKKLDDKSNEVKQEESEDEDLDPLDAFMKTINKEVTKRNGRKNINLATGNSKAKTITVVKTVVKKQVEEKIKPEVMEQNQDALEYSSEEEAPADITASDFDDPKKKRKELVVADHTKIYYAPYRRDFYVEVPELARMSADEVKLFRESLGDIQVRGKNIPKPLKSWAQAGLNTKIMNVLKKYQYEKPTPIQAQAIPVVMSGRDMIGIAKTGSGKTLAFVLPMLRHVLDQPALEEGDGPIAIIMTPTRELALQIYRESKKFCRPLQLSVSCIYGGSGISEQIAELKRGSEIIVCTPGRMIDMLAANNGKVTNCRRATYLVLDEADRMFDMGFEPQVMRIIDNIRPNRQTVLFSATFPRQMEAIARKVLTKPIEIQVGGRSVVCSDIEQHAVVIEADNKFFKLLELLGIYQENGSVLTFVEKQETADSLFKDLLKKGYPCLSLHGGMDQFDRDSTIADFKNGVTKLMVSTSVAARGLDVKNLVLVVNYDCPNHYEDYVHRVGRTGRAGNKGISFTFLMPDQGRNAGDITKAFELSKCEPPADVLQLWNSFKEDMEKEGKKVKLNSGFTGKGFKFNAEEAARVNESKKMRKFALGLQDSDDEAEAAETAMDKIEADLEKAFSSKPKIALAPEVVEAQKVKAAEQNVDKDKLKQASDIAALINKKLSSGQIVDRNTAATAHILHGGSLESLTGVGLAKQLADKVNAKLNYKPIEQETTQEAEKPNAVRYEEEIDINDFPQQARWRITSKEIIEQVRELSEAGVTVRGVYIPPNKKQDEEEKRLHLYIESLSERSIQIAKAEIKRLLKEELIRAESSTYRPNHQGRYKVL